MKPTHTKTRRADLLLCKYDSLSRWLWDEEFLKIIQQKYPDVPYRPSLGEPALALPGLGAEYFADNMPEIIDLTGGSLLMLGDKLFQCCSNAMQSQSEFQAAAPSVMGTLSGWVRGVSSKTGIEEEMMFSEPLKERTQIMPQQIITVSDLYEAKQKWVYLFRQHTMLIDSYTPVQPSRESTRWLQALQKRLPQWDLISKSECDGVSFIK
jgi:hypothetical protein